MLTQMPSFKLTGADINYYKKWNWIRTQEPPTSKKEHKGVFSPLLWLIIVSKYKAGKEKGDIYIKPSQSILWNDKHYFT